MKIDIYVEPNRSLSNPRFRMAPWSAAGLLWLQLHWTGDWERQLLPREEAEACARWARTHGLAVNPVSMARSL